MINNRVISFFNQNPAGYATKYGEQTAEGYAFRVRKNNLLEILGAGNGKILDIGCGPGVMTKDIANLGWTYFGSDLSPAMIQQAQLVYGNSSQISFKVGPVEKIDFPDNYFDVVVAMGLVEYLEDEVIALKEILRVLKKNGRIIVSIPNWWSPARMWDRWLITPAAKIWRLLTDKGPSTKLKHREYKVENYKKFLRNSGFEPLRIASYNYRIMPRPFDYWFPILAVKTASWFEKTFSPQLSFWGTSINVEAKKLP